MSTQTLFALAALSLVVVGLAIVFRNLLRHNNLASFSSQEPSMRADRPSLREYYSPMLRLLDAHELAAARALPGVSFAQWKQFRRERAEAFDLFLDDMRLDFARLEYKVRYVILSAGVEDAHLVGQLNKAKATFLFTLGTVEFRLWLFRMGLAQIDASGLVATMEALESSLNGPQRSLQADTAAA